MSEDDFLKILLYINAVDPDPCQRSRFRHNFLYDYWWEKNQIFISFAYPKKPPPQKNFKENINFEIFSSLGVILAFMNPNPWTQLNLDPAPQH
jgi:hypothetical protein